MKKTFWYGAIIAMLAMPIALFAAEFRVADQSSVQAQERIKGDMYIAGGSVTSAGSVAGDLVAGGGTVVVSGAVGADVIVGGGTITILSNVADDVRAGGGTIVIIGKVGGDVIAGGGQITIGGPGIGGDVVLGGGSIRIDAPVAGSLRIGGGTVYINAPITGDIAINAQKVTLGSAAIVYGNITYKAQEKFAKEEGATVHGKVKFEPQASKQIPVPAAVGFASLWLIGKFLALLVCALVIGLVFRRFSKEAVAVSVERPLLELGRGFVVAAALPALSVLMLVTVVGIPFGIIGLMGFVVFMLFSWITAPIIVGSVAYRYFSKRDSEITWKTILIGAFLFEIIGIVPFVGPLAQMFSMLIALGAVANIKWRVVQQWR